MVAKTRIGVLLNARVVWRKKLTLGKTIRWILMKDCIALNNLTVEFMFMLYVLYHGPYDHDSSLLVHILVGSRRVYHSLNILSLITVSYL